MHALRRSLYSRLLEVLPKQAAQVLQEHGARRLDHTLRKLLQVLPAGRVRVRLHRKGPLSVLQERRERQRSQECLREPC